MRKRRTIKDSQALISIFRIVSTVLKKSRIVSHTFRNYAVSRYTMKLECVKLCYFKINKCGRR